MYNSLMGRDTLSVPSYRKLVTEISSLYEGARKALVEAYWKIGQRIVQVEQQGAIKAAYGPGLLQKLSEDLAKQCGPGFSLSNLKRMRQFYLFHPKSPPAGELSWSQYAELLPIGDTVKRERLIQKAVREELDSKGIRELVQHELVREEVAENLVRRTVYGGKSADGDSVLLTPCRGVLYTYRIIRPKLVGENDSELLIDLGFSCTKDLDDVTNKKFEVDDIVISSKGAQGNYILRETRSSVSKTGSQKGVEDLYTYTAEVERVVDGDTLKVVVDLGFGIKTRQYLRLRGLDCPEMDTQEGKKAADFVRMRIRVASEIILTSSRSDKYDRYLADVYFTDPKGQEIYLNSLLLESGLAVRMAS
jgi:hypothetical protein